MVGMRYRCGLHWAAMDNISALTGLKEVAADLQATPYIVRPPSAGSLSFDKKSAGEHAVFAVLPVIYESVLTEVIPADSMPMDDRKQAAHEAIRARLPKGTEFEVFRHDNITAVVVHDPQSRQVTVAFDGGGGDARDISDNMNFRLKPHPLGGNMHSGYADSITRKDEDGIAISDRVLAQINAYAAQHGEQQLDVRLTGVSRGGSVATAALADWMQDGRGVQDNVHFKSLITFGSLAVGDEEFNNAFYARTKELKLTEQWRVIAGDDAVPRQFTQDALYKQDLSQGGNVVYLIPDEKGGITQLINPQKDDLDKARAHLNPLTLWHTVGKYAQALELPHTAFDARPENLYSMKDTNVIEAPGFMGSIARAPEGHIR